MHALARNAERQANSGTWKDGQSRLHDARVYLAEARKRRDCYVSRNFYWVLMGWAARVRTTYAANRLPQQRELFK